MRIALALALFAMPVAAQAAPGTCDVHGFVQDTDPKGTNLRGAPSATAPVVGHLPPQHYDKDAQTTLSAEFHIIGSQDGWLEIEDAEDGALGKDPTYTFKGPAWISGALVGFTVGSVKLRKAPAMDAPQVASLMGENFGADSYDVKRVYACKDRFVDIAVQLSPNMKKGAPLMRGWAATVCSNRLTTCDGGE
jgi:hypothetical protein